MSHKSTKFVDVAKIHVQAGNGGNGSVSFHREKYVPSGGPDGGDGGRGGDVIFKADSNLSTLMDFKYKRKYQAENGIDGGAKKCNGKKAPPLIIKVPVGTLIIDELTNKVMADLGLNDEIIIAKGGRGGWGNTHFATPTRQIPRFAKPGKEGESFDLRLELKLIADVGLIGFPNVGKSTIISIMSAAKPKIANYHFTTLSPVLGVVRVGEEQSFTLADIPGLIEGAAEGIGLGHSFLRHVERCRLLLHVVDVSGCEGRDPIDDFEKINKELLSFSSELSKLPQIVLGNKTDIATPEQIQTFKDYVEAKGYEFFEVSAAQNKGFKHLPGIIWQHLQDLSPVKTYEVDYVKPEIEEKHFGFEIEKLEDNVFEIKAPWLEDILTGSSMDDYESLMYFQLQLEEHHVLEKLQELGVQENDTIYIDDYSFEYKF